MGKDAAGAVDQLLELVADSRPVLSAQAIRALGAIGCADKRVRFILANRWRAPAQLQTGDLQLAIALCKLRIPAHNLLEILTKTLAVNQDAGFRKAAAEALTWCSQSEIDVVPALLSASLGDSCEDVRQMAQAALDRMGVSHEQAIDLCARQLGDSSYAETALKRSGPLAVPALIEMLKAKDSATQVKAAQILGFLGEAAAEAGPALVARSQDKDLEVRLAVVKGLWNVTKTPDVVVPVLAALLDGKGQRALEDGETRRRFLQTVMEALGRIGPPAIAAVPALTALAKDGNRHIREAALVTRQKIVPTVAMQPGLRRSTQPRLRR
jgi:HEAT repeat protein